MKIKKHKMYDMYLMFYLETSKVHVILKCLKSGLFFKIQSLMVHEAFFQSSQTWLHQSNVSSNSILQLKYGIMIFNVFVTNSLFY